MWTRYNRNLEIEQAIALLIQNQAALVAEQARSAAQHRETERAIEAMKRDIEQIKAILRRHDEILAGLPEAIRQKIGFKPE
jgi:hypothetical protein